MSRANHLEMSVRKPWLLLLSRAKNGVHASEIVELADINMALKTWLGLGTLWLLNVTILTIELSEHTTK